MTAKPAADQQRPGRYVPAAGRAALTPVYDLAVRLTMRERLFRETLLTQTVVGLDAGHVLDVGCGTGTLALALARRAPQTTVRGVNGDASILDIARRKDPDARVAWTQGHATALPFKDRRFDRVVASLLLHHLNDHDKLQALREARRVLRPAGRLHIADWGRPRGLAPRAGFTALRLLDGRDNTRLHASGQLPELVAHAGFAPVTLTSRIPTLWGTLELLRAHPR